MTTLGQRRARDQELRRARLSTPYGLETYNHTISAWARFRREAHVRLTWQVKIPLALFQVPGFDGRGAGRSRGVGARGRPPGGGLVNSTLGSLATGGRDGLALRLYLTIIAVKQFAPHMAAAIPLMPPEDDPSAIAWASLTHVPMTVRAGSRRPGKTPEGRRGDQRSRMKDAVDHLRTKGLVTPIHGPRGSVVGLEVAPLPPDVPVTERAGCTDVWLPVTYWVMGWNAVLWADDIINFLAFCSLPESDVYGIQVTFPDGRTSWINESTFPSGESADKDEPKRVPNGKKARWMSRGRRVQQFGIHDVRYSKRGDLRAFRLLERVTSPNRPTAGPNELDDWLMTVGSFADGTPIPEPGQSATRTLVVVEASPGPLSVGGYQVNFDALSNDGRAAVTRAFESVSAKEWA